MKLIDTEEGAWRLARAVVADLRLYNADKLEQLGPGGIPEEIAEGRGLFTARVEPRFHALFDQAVEQGLGPSRGFAPPRMAVPHPPVRALEPGGPESAFPRTTVVALAILVALVAVAAIVWSLAR
jgi:hypothetical protein